MGKRGPLKGGGGRPESARLSTAIKLRMKPQFRDAIDRAAKESGVDASEYIRAAVEMALAASSLSVTSDDLRQKPELLAQLETGQIGRLVVTREKVDGTLVAGRGKKEGNNDASASDDLSSVSRRDKYIWVDIFDVIAKLEEFTIPSVRAAGFTLSTVEAAVTRLVGFEYVQCVRPGRQGGEAGVFKVTETGLQALPFEKAKAAKKRATLKVYDKKR